MDKRTYGHLLAALLCVTIQHSFGQVQNSLFGEYRLDPANPPANFTIGNVYAAGLRIDCPWRSDGHTDRRSVSNQRT